MSLRGSVHTKIEEIEGWDQVGAFGGAYSSSAFLRAIGTPSDRFVAVRDGDRLMAVAPCRLVRSSSDVPASSNVHRLFGAGAAAPELYPFLYVGPAWGFKSYLLIDSNVGPEQRARVLSSLQDTIRAHGASHGVNVIAYGYHPAEEMREMVESDNRLLAVPTELDFSLESVTTFDAYLTSLGGKRRRRIGADIRGLEAAGLTLKTTRLSEVVREFCEVAARHEQKLGYQTTAAEFFEHYEPWLTSGIDPQTRLVGAYRGSVLVGGALFLVSDRRMYSRDFGATADVPQSASLYFNLQFYEAVRLAERERVEVIHYGRTSLAPKVSRGCSARPLWWVIEPTVPLGPEARSSIVAASREHIQRDVKELETMHDADWILRMVNPPEIEAALARLV